jgi:hypothetical protein
MFFEKNATCFVKIVEVVYFLRKIQLALKKWLKLYISKEKCNSALKPTGVAHFLRKNITQSKKIAISMLIEKSATNFEKKVGVAHFWRKVQLVSKTD